MCDVATMEWTEVPVGELKALDHESVIRTSHGQPGAALATVSLAEICSGSTEPPAVGRASFWKGVESVGRPRQHVG